VLIQREGGEAAFIILISKRTLVRHRSPEQSRANYFLPKNSRFISASNGYSRKAGLSSFVEAIHYQLFTFHRGFIEHVSTFHNTSRSYQELSAKDLIKGSYPRQGLT